MPDPSGTSAAKGQQNTQAATHPLNLPPMLLVAINEAATDIPDKASWADRSIYAFTYRVSDQDAEIRTDPTNPVYDLRKAPFLEEVLQWIWHRLDIAPAEDPAEPTFGAITQAWWWQKDVIRVWNEDPMGLDEQWAQRFSELFCGVAYNGHGEAYAMDLDLKGLPVGSLNSDWDAYIYSRIQPSFLEQVVVVDKVGGKTGRGIQSWNDLTAKQMSKDEAAGRRWIASEDPAAPIMAACQYIATYVLLTRGFFTEPEAGEQSIATNTLIRALTAAPCDHVPALDWMWFPKRGDSQVVAEAFTPSPLSEAAEDLLTGALKVSGLGPFAQWVKEANHRPQLRPGSIATYHAYHKFANNVVALPAEPKSQPPESPPKPGWQVDMPRKIALDSNGEAPATDAVLSANMAAWNITRDDSKVTAVSVTGQPAGSHIHAVLRVRADRKRAQLFDSGGAETAHNTLVTVGRATCCGPQVGAAMETIDYERIGTMNDKSNGIGFARESAAVPFYVESLAKTRPVGLARLVLAHQPSPTKDKPPRAITSADVLFVSKVFRSYAAGSHQNFVISRYMWSLRNIPGFSNVRAYWILYSPRGKLARAMWAYGARSKTLSEYVATHNDGKPILFPGDFTWLQIVSSAPTGLVEISWRMGTTVASGFTTSESRQGELPAFFSQSLPGLSGKGDMILPDIKLVTGANGMKQPMMDPAHALAWDAQYLRADIEPIASVPSHFVEN